MNLFDYCDAINARLTLTRYENQNGRWMARFNECEVKEKGFLVGCYGNGVTPDEAMKDYCKQISGAQVVFNAYTDARTEFTVPQLEVV